MIQLSVCQWENYLADGIADTLNPPDNIDELGLTKNTPYSGATQGVG